MPRFILLLTLVILTMVPAPSWAQVHGSIDVTADPGGTNCALPNVPFPEIFVVARPNFAAPAAGLTGALFNVDLTAYLTLGAGVVLAEFPPAGAGSLGSVLGSGVEVFFSGVCQTTPAVLLYTIQIKLLLPIGGGPHYVSVIPSGLWPGQVAMFDCPGGNLHSVPGGQGVINGTCSIAVEETTWGKLKELYSQ